MRSARYYFAGCILAVSLICFPAEAAAAQKMTDAGVNVESRIEDTIVYKYRVWNGRMQYRRWNVTRQCWVDPEWLDA